MKRPSRRLGAAAATAVAALASFTLTGVLGGCSERSPTQSIVPYDPSDGVVANLGSLAVRNLLVVAAGQGQPGVVSGALVNTGSSDLTVTFTAAGDSTPPPPVSVPAHQLVRLGTGNGATTVQLSSVDVVPGALLAMRVATPPTGPRVLQVPVLSPQLEYATLTPTTPPPTATPSSTDTPSGTTTTS